MSYIEFQISVPAFLGAQRNALRSNKGILCSPVPIPVGPVQIILDRIEFGNNAIRHNVETDFAIFYEDHGETLPTPNTPTGFKTQIAQDVTVFVSSLNDILLRPNQPPLISVPVSGTLVFDLDYFSLVDECYIQVRFTRFEPGPLPFLPANFDPKILPLPITIDQILEVVNKKLAAAIPSPAMPAGLGKMVKGVRFMNSGVSVDSQLQFIAFRTQIGGSSSSLDVPWGNFFKGFFEDRLQGRDWSLSIDTGYIATALRVMVEQALRKVNIDHLQTFPGCGYSNEGGKAFFTINVLSIYDLPDPLGTIESDPKLPIQLSVDNPNWLTVDIDLSQVLDESDFYIQIASAFAHLIGIPVESILMALIGSAAMEFLAGTPLANCKQLSATNIQCSNPVRLPQVPGALQVALTSLLAMDDAISLAGTLTFAELTPASLRTSVREFQKEAPSITCGPAGLSLVAAFQNDASGFLILHAKGFIENDGRAPLYLCDFKVMNDSLGAFTRGKVHADSDQAFLTISLDMSIMPQGYYDNPYNCDLLVKTSAGTRLLSFAPPPVVTQHDLDLLAAELLVAIGNCEQLVDPWFTHHQGYNPQWGPRPPEGMIAEHLWQMRVTGLQEGETASLVNALGQELVRATARAGEALRLSAVVSPGGETELTILRNAGQVGLELQHSLALDSSSTETGTGDTGQGIEVGQTLLIEQGSIPMQGEANHLLLASLENGLNLMAVMDDGITAYNLEDPSRPTPVQSWGIEGLRGALNWQGGLLFFGDEGFGQIDRHGRQTTVTMDCSPAPVLDAEGNAMGIYTITSNELIIYSIGLCKMSSTSLERCRSLLLAGGKLVVGGKDGLRVYDISDLRQPASVTFLEGLNVTKVLRSPLMEPGGFLAILEDGTAKSFWWNGEQLIETASYNQAPWFAESLRISGMLVRIGEGRARLDLYRFGDTQIL